VDESLPLRLRRLLPDHDCETVDFRGWKGLRNGDLLRRAAAAGFRVFLTADRNVARQQSFAALGLAIVLVTPSDRRSVQACVERISDAISAAAPGTVTVVKVG